ncbi:MAG: DHH family phosphoesterase [Oscillospiraceae bacterium]|nr:DHH family phosphoesterase [Oscillospiraceae bacterium]
MKNKFWGTDLMLFVLVIVATGLGIVLGFAAPQYMPLVISCLLAVVLMVFINAHSVRKIIRGVFFGYGKQSARQQLSFENLTVPVAIVNKGSIVWYNSAFRNDILGESDCYLTPLAKVVPGFKIEDGAGKNGISILINNREYTAFSSLASEDNSLWVCYFVDDTNLKWEAREYHLTRPVVIQVIVDTYDEVLKELKESKRAQIMAELDKLIEDSANDAKGIATKVGTSRYHVIIEERYFPMFYDSRFEILNRARNIEKDMVTLSIGVGRGGNDFAENDMLARQALDMALGRGGDQAVIKSNEGYEFFGGVLPSVEKRSKVRSRIVAKALKDVIMQADNVLIMGHSNSDLDAIGSGVGVAAMVESLGKRPYIVVRDDVTLAYNLIDKVRNTQGYEDLFITPEKAQAYAMGAGTLLIVVDTHTAKMTESADLVNKCSKKVVIDHHRRMVGYISDTVVSYHEPYASSASELVCELIPYIIPADYKLKHVVAEAMLAGIMLDTRNFAEKAGVRTFEAAAWLRRQGAVSTEVLRMFNVPKEVYKAKSHLVNDAFIYKDVAVSLAENMTRDLYVAVPQAANDLLTLDGVLGSVVAVKFDDQISISARSLGEINVQVLMEYLGGGGHLTMAGAQLRDCTLEEAGEKIKESIDNYKK